MHNFSVMETNNSKKAEILEKDSRVQLFKRTNDHKEEPKKQENKASRSLKDLDEKVTEVVQMVKNNSARQLKLKL